MALPDGTTITWYGHSVVRIDTARGKTVIIDPFFGEPRSPIAAEAVERCDVLLVTHGHDSHGRRGRRSPAGFGPRGRASTR